MPAGIMRTLRVNWSNWTALDSRLCGQQQTAAAGSVSVRGLPPGNDRGAPVLLFHSLHSARRRRGVLFNGRISDPPRVSVVCSPVRREVSVSAGGAFP